MLCGIILLVVGFIVMATSSSYQKGFLLENLDPQVIVGGIIFLVGAIMMIVASGGKKKPA